MKTLASFGAGRTLLTAVGVQPRQYQVLVDLFGTLGERKELLGNLGMDRHAMNLTSLGLLIPGGFIALFAFGGGSLAAFNMITPGAELAGVVHVARDGGVELISQPGRGCRAGAPADRRRHLLRCQADVSRDRRAARDGRAQRARRPGRSREARSALVLSAHALRGRVRRGALSRAGGVRGVRPAVPNTAGVAGEECGAVGAARGIDAAACVQSGQAAACGPRWPRSHRARAASTGRSCR